MTASLHPPRRARGPGGFTLVEILMVIVIITILLALAVTIIVTVIDQARYTKTKGLIEMLDRACQNYKQDFNEYPPGGSSRDLHERLGSVRMMVASWSGDGGQPITVQKNPYIEFRRDMLQGEPEDTYPHTPREIIDAWGRAIHYANPGRKNPKAVDIWSDGAKPTTEADDIGNWGP